MHGGIAMIVEALLNALGAERVSRDPAELARVRRDAWVLSDLDELEQRPVELPLCVVRPQSTSDVVTVVQLCRQRATPLVPSGLRSGVCGGVLAGATEVVLDMSSMRAMQRLDTVDLTATFEAGARGSDAETRVNEAGLTLGHFPQSIARSSVGGWVATRAAGQFSTGYGNIEDLVLGLEAVLPDGSVLTTRDAPRASAGPDLKQLLFGSEGTLGVVTAVTFALHRLPALRYPRAYHVRDMAAGFEAQRAVLQGGQRPVVLRQYDAREVGRLFKDFRKDEQCLLLVLHEGSAAKVEAEERAVREILEHGGASRAPDAACEHWLAERNHVPDFKSFLEHGLVVDTIEVAAPWSRIGALYDDAIAALAKLPGVWNGSAHSSHAYRSGLNLYFSFACQPQEKQGMRQAYFDCWQAVMAATLRAGGTISHHHGIGRVRRAWLERELGKTGVELLRSIKRTLDPVGFMNPGVLLPDP
jgi:alkyldihydroxyacetonephosphate synthase